MAQVTLFTDILPEEQERMRVCFRAKKMCFQNNETVLEYASSMNQIGVILYGRADGLSEMVKRMETIPKM
ncbi:hypothetical protein LK511_03680 [Faecalicatena orotica]|nr:hypothetical protein [Faecalicatena orotica]